MSAPPKEVIVAALRGDVETLRDWFAAGNREPNAVFDFFESWSQSYSDDSDAEEEPINGGLLHCLMLHLAKKRSDAADAVRLLLAHGADPNLQNDAGMTPIRWCEFPGEMNVLLDGGADVHALKAEIVFRRHGLALVKLASRHGVIWDFEGKIWKRIMDGDATTVNEKLKTVITFIRELKSAGSWKAYKRQPRVELVRLRSLCARGRATPPPELERLFDCPSSATTKKPKAARAARPLPNEVFWHVLSFWRSSRDD
jgi:hypothetical protein